MADHRLELPGGHWADLRDPKEVTRKQRKPIARAARRLNRYKAELKELDLLTQQERASEETGIHGVVPVERQPSKDEAADDEEEEYSLNEEEIEMMEAVQEPLAVALVEAWSFEQPITLEGLNDISGPASDKLVIYCAQFLGDLFVAEEPTDDGADPTTP